ncbi:MAG TPA: hypothetical protein VGX48_27930 [Pyrinomonadaceae bacterium]|jgi:hypothetical protein|nr:hypothetical protein [Pyrinomonadaceae bacterium]
MPTLAYLQVAVAGEPGGKARAIRVTVPMGGDVTAAVARALLSELGLRSDAQAVAFSRQAGYDLARHAATQLQGQRIFTSQVEAARRQGRRELTVTVAVALAIVNDVRRFLSMPPAAAGGPAGPGAAAAGTGAQGNRAGSGPAGPPPKPVEKMTTAEKIAEAIRRSIPMLPADAREEVEALLTPQALSVMAGVLVLWVVAHFFGIGEIADVVLLVVGVVALGGVAVQAAEELYNFASYAVGAKREEDLDRAAKHFSEAVTLIGIQAVMAILLKKSPKVFRQGHNNAPTYTVRGLGPAPRTPGRLFYRPKVTADPTLPRGEGYTTAFGDIYYSSRGTPELQRLVRVHERVHQLLTPKLQFLREVRVVISQNGYSKSYILRYLEEALAETAAQVGVHGLRNAVEGITFPVKNGYVTLAGMRTEAAGMMLGPVNVGGMVYRAYFSTFPPSERKLQPAEGSH